MNQLLLTVPILTGLVALTADSAPADACTLSGYSTQVVNYWVRGPAYDHHDERCDYYGDCRLSGWVIAPADGTHDLPAIVLEHGSGGNQPTPDDGDPNTDRQSLSGYCEMIDYFVNLHYVVFMPFRRGVSDQTPASMVQPGAAIGFHNTGWDEATWSQLMATAYPGPQANVSWMLTYMEDEAVDIRDALAKVGALVRPNGNRLVDPDRIAIMGHSMGGVVATIASATAYGPNASPPSPTPRAVVNLSGGAMSWRMSHYYPDEQIPEAADHRYPILFQRVLNEDGGDGDSGAADGVPGPNGWTFESAQLQYNAAVQTGIAQIWRYPAITLNSTEIGRCASLAVPIPDYWCVHGNFVSNSRFVPLWIGHVHDFLVGRGV